MNVTPLFSAHPLVAKPTGKHHVSTPVLFSGDTVTFGAAKAKKKSKAKAKTKQTDSSNKSNQTPWYKRALSRTGQGIKNGFINTIDMFRPSNWGRLACNTLFWTALITGISAIFTGGLSLAAAPATAGMWIAIDAALRFFDGAIQKPENFESNRKEHGPKRTGWIW